MGDNEGGSGEGEKTHHRAERTPASVHVIVLSDTPVILMTLKAAGSKVRLLFSLTLSDGSTFNTQIALPCITGS